MDQTKTRVPLTPQSPHNNHHILQRVKVQTLYSCQEMQWSKPCRNYEAQPVTGEPHDPCRHGYGQSNNTAALSPTPTCPLPPQHSMLKHTDKCK